MIRVRAIDFNQTRYYNIRDEDKVYIESIHSVFIYNPNSCTHLCELTPSYDLRYLYTYIKFAQDVSEEKMSELDEQYCYEDTEDMYKHCADVKALESKDCGEFEDMEEACEYLRGNWPI